MYHDNLVPFLHFLEKFKLKHFLLYRSLTLCLICPIDFYSMNGPDFNLNMCMSSAFLTSHEYELNSSTACFNDFLCLFHTAPGWFYLLSLSDQLLPLTPSLAIHDIVNIACLFFRQHLPLFKASNHFILYHHPSSFRNILASNIVLTKVTNC